MGKFSKFIVDTGRIIKQAHQVPKERTTERDEPREIGKHKIHRDKPMTVSEVLFNKTRKGKEKSGVSVPERKFKLSDIIFGNAVRNSKNNKGEKTSTLFRPRYNNKAKGKLYEKRVFELWLEKHPKVKKWQINREQEQEIVRSILGSAKKNWYSKGPIYSDIKKRKDDLLYNRGAYGTKKYGYTKKQEARKELEILKQSDPKFEKTD